MSHISKDTLALLGFYFLTQPDTVKCNFCGVEIKWKIGDDVLSDHQKWSPSCKLICSQPTDNISIDPNRQHLQSFEFQVKIKNELD